MNARWPWVGALALLVALVGLWALRADAEGPSVPAPAAVWDALVELTRMPEAWAHLQATLGETLAGFAIAAAIGTACGLLLGAVPLLEQMLAPFLAGARALPVLVLLPLIILWFGTGAPSKAGAAAVAALLPVMIHAARAVRAIDPRHREMMSSIDAGRIAIFTRLELPSALPSILSGLQAGMVAALGGALVCEFLAPRDGVGALLLASVSSGRIDRALALLAVIGLLAALLHGLFALAIAGVAPGSHRQR